VYLHHVANFLDFVAGSPKNLRHLGMRSNEVTSLAVKVRLVAKSLKKDIAKAAVERFVFLLPSITLTCLKFNHSRV